MKRTFLAAILFAGLLTTKVSAQDSVVTLPSVTVRSHAMVAEQVDKSLNAYNMYKITRVAKVVRSDQSFWIINLEGLNNFIVLRAEDGELSEVSKISKTD